MVPTITAQGTSFFGAYLYYFHDKGERSRDRIGFTDTLNMLTDSVDKAWKVMAYTAKSAAQLKKASGQKVTGAKLKKAVFAYSLSWHPEQNPSKEHMLEAAKDSLAALGLSEHEAMIAEHTDEPHPHLHIVVNKVHPLTGLVAKLKYTKEKLSDFAHKLERKEGKMYCSQREENRSKREDGQKSKYVNPIVEKAWHLSKSGAEFKSNLEDEGYQLAQGNRCIVVVDPRGKPQSAARALGIRAKELKSKLGKSEIENLKSFEQAKADLKDVATHAQQKTQQSENDSSPMDIFIEQKAEALVELHLRQQDEFSELSAKHDRSIERKRHDLSEFYQFDRKHIQIAELEGKLEKSGFFQKLFGLHRRREIRLEELKAGLSNAHERFDEAINPMITAKAKALEQLKMVHTEQRDTLSHNFDKWKPSYSQNSRGNDRGHSRPHSRKNDGPSFER